MLKNEKLSTFLKVPVGALVLNLIREFLKFFELDFTLSVFEPETKYNNDYNEITRDKMINELKITDLSKKYPLLVQVIEKIININKSPVCKDSNIDIAKVNDKYDCGDHGNNTISPVPPLNSTFIKKSEIQLSPISPVENESREDTNDSIKEAISNNYRYLLN